MATQTKNYKFKKPDRKEFFNVADLNDNLDAIDGVLGEKQEAEVKDTNNILGAGPGKKALIQTLFDSIGDWFINKLVTNDNFVSKFSERLVNNGTANLEGFALDARQGNPTVEGSLAKQISKLKEEVAPLLYENAGAHNAIYRGKNLGSSVTSAQYAAISSGKFTDLYIGDYWIINGVTWRIAAFDYWMNCGDTATTKHHIVVVPDNNLYTHKMNDTNVTTGGYVGSKMHKEGLTQAKNTIKSAFSGHVLSHRVYLTNTVANGRPSAGAWLNSEVDLMTEAMVYGTNVFSPVSDGTNIPANYNVDYKQLPLFALAPQLICNRNWYWLQNVVSAAYFAIIGNDGAADSLNASRDGGVRPAFAIS